MKLLIHPRKGLYQLTICPKCGHMWECLNCSSKLVVYKKNQNQLEMLCHQCQTVYNYPEKCQVCGNQEIVSKYGGIDDLEEILKQKMNLKVLRLDNKKNLKNLNQAECDVALTTRIFDPALDYQKFEVIIFIQAENILAGVDYMVYEDLLNGITQLLLEVKDQTRIIFDTKTNSLNFFYEIKELCKNPLNSDKILSWHAEKLKQELEHRKKYQFPPFTNLLLFTSQEKVLSKAVEKLKAAKRYLENCQDQLQDVQIFDVYPAKLLKRKGYYSYHLLLKYPRNYSNFKQLQKISLGLASLYNLQLRNNPNNLF